MKAGGEEGKNGADGQDGADGKTPYIGENGNWWIGDSDTGIKAVAEPAATQKGGCMSSYGGEAMLLMLFLAVFCAPMLQLKKRDGKPSVL